MKYIFLIVVLLASVANATDYYISNAGSDAAAGTEGAPWEFAPSMASATGNSVAKDGNIAAGETVFFNKGDTWRETVTPGSSGSIGSPITYSSYGTGDRPILSGADILTGWTIVEPELVVNGTFTGNANNWTLDPVWTYNANAIDALADGSSDYLTQDEGVFVVGKTYSLTYSIANSDMDVTGLGMSSDSIFPSTILDDTNGAHQVDLEAVNSSPMQEIRLFIHANSTPGKVLTLDDVSIKELGIYSTAAATEIRGLWVGGVFQNRSRWPESGWENIDSAGTTTTLQSDALTQIDDYWNTDYVLHSDSDFTTKMRQISDFDQGTETITWTGATIASKLDYGFYIDGNLDYLNDTGEWTWKVDTAYLCDYTQDPDDGDEVLGAVRDYCVVIDTKDYITITELDLRYAGIWAIKAHDGSNIIIDNNVIQDCAFGAIWVEDIGGGNEGPFAESDIVISDNVITNMNARYEVNSDAGIRVFFFDTVSVTGNTLTNIGINATSPVVSTGITIRCDDATVSGNTIDFVSGVGIKFNDSGDNYLVAENTIINFMEYASDQSAIYCSHIPGQGVGTGNIVEKNLIHTANGYIEGTNKATVFIKGIHCDESTSGLIIRNNIIHTITGNSSGLMLHKAYNLDIYNNTISGVYYGIWMSEKAQNQMSDIVLTNNICADSGGGYPIRVARHTDSTSSIGTFNNNIYFPSDGEHVMFYGERNSEVEYTLAEWQGFTGFGESSQDADSDDSDPLFVYARGAKWQTHPTSFAIDGGINVGQTEDYLGNAINGFHMGAFNKYGPYLIGN